MSVTLQPTEHWARSSLHASIHDRELGWTPRPRRTIRSIYGDQTFVRDLDIVNELSGHTGCVNALSWSKSGRLLASGSDDKYVNIFRYQPEDSSQQFAIATSISTGHSANIFSVKFMPHSNDRTIVSCAGDREVRVFDLEHSAASSSGINHHAPFATRARRTGATYSPNARYLTSNDPTCRVYRSHRERVKRIVTESSPHLFLTCSEDGEVRQWDLRQPSSAYPAHQFDDDSVPPPLISYRDYGLDLNTISCSPSQPHYIALGGAHLHCLLHDRRFLGRDRLKEAGRGGSINETDLEQATRCVRKFAPNGQQRMRRNDSGHITGCKISDANPNEIIASWSGDGIYSFDLIRSPHADESNVIVTPASDRKRKRTRASMVSIPDAGKRAEPRLRTEDAHEMSLRVHYANGQTEEVPLQHSPTFESDEEMPSLPEHVRDIAQGVMELGEYLFGRHAEMCFSSLLGTLGVMLPAMKHIQSSWSYPVNASPTEIYVQRKRREHRETTIRFVQAAGVCLRVLGNGAQDLDLLQQNLAAFERVQVLSTEGPDITRSEQFVIDFVRAIFLWLDSGIGSLLEGFSSTSAPSGKIRRFPVPPDADQDAVDERLIPYLLELASDTPVKNIEISRFERRENRTLFASEADAVRRFAEAVKTPFADLSGNNDVPSDGIEFQDRASALQFWARTVARSLLKKLFKSLNVDLITQAFGAPVEEESRSFQDPESERNNSENASESSGSSGNTDEDDDTDEMHDDDDEDGITDEDGDSDTEDDSDDYEEYGFSRNPLRAGKLRYTQRNKVEAHVQCVPHTRVYKGHCNVQTVKDVNFYGLDDEYVVSGSDDGNLFIWDRKTAKLLNILSGDGEVVNVVQAHPYEPMLAVSGIDDTIKVFSADARAREAARLGSGVSAADPSRFSSVHWPSRAFGRRRTSHQASRESASGPGDNLSSSLQQEKDSEDEDFVAPSGLASRKRIHQEYQITSQNDARRHHGDMDNSITIEDILAVFFRRGG